MRSFAEYCVLWAGLIALTFVASVVVYAAFGSDGHAEWVIFAAWAFMAIGRWEQRERDKRS